MLVADIAAPCVQGTDPLTEGGSLEPLILVIAVFIFSAAMLYSSVGHGGASAYLAVMALAGVTPEEMRPAALTLNILVAGIGSWRFLRAGLFDARLFWPVALASVPLAFLGGTITLSAVLYQPLVGLALLYAAWQFFSDPVPATRTARPHTLAVVLAGAVIGLLSGLTGVGGGIFLSPLLILLAWAPVRETSGIAACFVLVNSIAALAGTLGTGTPLPEGLALWAVAAVCGGLLGTELGSRRLPPPMLRRLLGLVLAIAGAKMVLSL